MTNTNKFLLLTSVSALFGIQTVHATSAFTPSSTVTITIDSITNNTTDGDLSGLEINGAFQIANSNSAPGFGQTVTGDGNSTYNYTGGSIDSSTSTVNAGDSFSQTFSSIGNANNGSVDAYYQAFGELGFVNNSSDSYSIEYSINYDLNAVVTGDFASNTVALEYFNDLGDIYGYKEAAGSTLLLLTDQNASSASFTLDLSANTSDTFYADVSINGYAEAVATVPVPAAGWLMLSSLVFLRNYRKSAV